MGLAREGGHRANLQEEAARLRQLRELGIPALEPLGIVDFEGRPGLVMPRYEMGSKEIVRQAKGSRRIDIVGSSKYLNARSIQDLEHIRALLIKLEVSVNDLQFLIGRDGQVVVNDPLEVICKKTSGQNLKMINKLIEAARRNVR